MKNGFHAKTPNRQGDAPLPWRAAADGRRLCDLVLKPFCFVSTASVKREQLVAIVWVAALRGGHDGFRMTSRRALPYNPLRNVTVAAWVSPLSPNAPS
jgi:hypothetical protein